MILIKPRQVQQTPRKKPRFPNTDSWVSFHGNIDRYWSPEKTTEASRNNETPARTFNSKLTKKEAKGNYLFKVLNQLGSHDNFRCRCWVFGSLANSIILKTEWDDSEPKGRLINNNNKWAHQDSSSFPPAIALTNSCFKLITVSNHLLAKLFTQAGCSPLTSGMLDL